MAKICEYCGRQLDEGEECGCPGAVAAREREAMEGKAQAVSADASDGGTAEELPQSAQPVDASANEQAVGEASAPVQDASKADFKAADAALQIASSAGFAAADGICAEDASADKTSAADTSKAPKSKVEEVLGSTGAEVALDLKDLFTGMFTSPVETMRENARRQDHASSYIIAAILSVLVFIIIAIVGDNPFINQAIGRGTLVIFALSAAVAIFVFKAVYAACLTLWGKKYNPELTYFSALSTFCLLGIYDIVLLLAFTFFTALSIYELGIAIVFFWLIVMAVSGIVAGWVLTDGKAESVVRFNLVLLFIFIVLIVLSLRGIVIEMCAGALFVVMNTLAGF